MNDFLETFEVQLYNFDEKGNCFANITLAETGMKVNELKVMQGLGGGIMVHMPAWMHTRWSYPDIEWSTVRKLVTEEYHKIMKGKECQLQSESHTECKFYSVKLLQEVSVNIVLPVSQIRVEDICLIMTDTDQINIHMPKWMNKEWKYTEISWEEVCCEIEEVYRKRHSGKLDTKSDINDHLIEINNEREILSCLVDIKLTNRNNIIKGFRLKSDDTSIRISTPKWMGRWNDAKYSWDNLCKIIKDSYQQWRAEDNSKTKCRTDEAKSAINQIEKINGNVEASQTKEVIDFERDDLPKKTITKEKNEYGRIKNADSSALRFFPRSVLRLSNQDESERPKKKVFELVNALSKGSIGGIGPFEINILDWVERLRFVTSTMLLDLIRGGYVSTGWREDISQTKLAKIIARMNQYDLISLSRFVTVDENGLPEDESKMTSMMRIITLGRTGNTMLHELGRNESRFNAFDTFQDGNTVKRWLSANQWLIYWLTTYPKEVGENYETAEVIYRKSSDFEGARFYATVTCNDYTMVAEPIRRVEEFEEKEVHFWLRHKFERFLNLFSNLDELYIGQEEISFMQRPTIVYICEDDDHMKEVQEIISDLLSTHPEQTVWFTTDLRIFNYNMAGERFFENKGNILTVVDMQATIGVTDLPPVDM